MKKSNFFILILVGVMLACSISVSAWSTNIQFLNLSTNYQDVLSKKAKGNVAYTFNWWDTGTWASASYNLNYCHEGFNKPVTTLYGNTGGLTFTEFYPAMSLYDGNYAWCSYIAKSNCSGSVCLWSDAEASPKYFTPGSTAWVTVASGRSNNMIITGTRAFFNS